MIHNIETKLIRRRNVGWEEAKRGTFGFKLKHHLGQLKELDKFGNGLLIVVTSLKFGKLNDDFQKKKKERKMKSDILDIKSSSNVLIFADETTNIYKASLQE